MDQLLGSIEHCRYIWTILTTSIYTILSLLAGTLDFGIQLRTVLYVCCDDNESMNDLGIYIDGIDRRVYILCIYDISLLVRIEVLVYTLTV